MEVERRSLSFFFSLRISHPRSGNYSVCDGFYTHSVSHAHFSDTFSLRDVQTPRTRMAQGVCSAHVRSLHLTFSILNLHPPSLLFPDGHFETTFPTLTSAPSLPNCSPSESAGQAQFRTSGGSLATWPIPRTPQNRESNCTCREEHHSHFH